VNFFESLAQLATRRPIAVSVVAITVTIIGYLAWQQRPIDLLPDLQSPSVVVSLRAGDRPPAEMERLFGENLEQQIFTVKDVRNIEQVARTGRIIATVTFDWAADLDIGLIDIQKAVGSLESDPNVDEIVVRRFDPRQDPILVYGMVAPSGAPNLIELRQLAKRQLASALEQLPGVAEVQVTGGRLKEIRVQVDRYQLDAFNIPLSLLENQLNSENQDITAGTVEENDRVLQLRSRSRFNDAQDIRDLVVRYVNTEGGIFKPIRVKDFAEVIEAEQEVDHVVLVDGIEGVGLSIYKEAGANTVEVSRTLTETIEKLSVDLPNIELKQITDNAVLVVDALDDLQIAAVIGIFLAVVILAIFLRSAGATLIVTAAVPVSICSTLFFMHLGDYSLNIVTLGGLALGAGMLVDNAIVVVESMYRNVSQGHAPEIAAAKGTSQVAGAITASTLTTCVVFLPVFFVQGLAARLIEGIAFTVVLSLLASLVVAIFLIPALGKWFLPKETSDLKHNRVENPGAIRTGVENFTRLLLRAPSIVVGTAILITGTAIYFLVQLGTELLPPADPKQFSLRLVGTAGQRVESTVNQVKGIEDIIRQSAPDHIAASLSEIGRIPDDDRIIRQEMTEENTARVNVRVAEGGPTGRHVASQLQDVVEELPNAEIEWEINKSALASALGTSGVPILIEVAGQELPDIRRGVSLIQEELEKLPQIWNIRNSFEGGPPELHIELDHAYADALQVNVQSVSRVLESSIDGRIATRMSVGDEEYPITIRMDTPRKENLGNIKFRTGQGVEVAIGEVAEFKEVEGAREVHRRNQRRTGQITAQVTDGYELPQAIAAVNEVLVNTPIPAGLQASLRGEEEERVKTFSELRLAGILAILLVLMVLAGSFESVLQPITVLASIPLALVGVSIAMVPMGDPVGVMAMLGLIVLSGVAVNDAVLLISTSKQLIRDGVERREALAQAVGIRLRPVTMTTLTTALALTPLLFGGGEGAVLRQPMAMTIIGGIITSTIGSLMVLPSLYLLLDNLSRMVRGVKSTPDLVEQPS